MTKQSLYSIKGAAVLLSLLAFILTGYSLAHSGDSYVLTDSNCTGRCSSNYPDRYKEAKVITRTYVKVTGYFDWWNLRHRHRIDQTRSSSQSGCCSGTIQTELPLQSGYVLVFSTSGCSPSTEIAELMKRTRLTQESFIRGNSGWLYRAEVTN